MGAYPIYAGPFPQPGEKGLDQGIGNGSLAEQKQNIAVRTPTVKAGILVQVLAGAAGHGHNPLFGVLAMNADVSGVKIKIGQGQGTHLVKAQPGIQH